MVKVGYPKLVRLIRSGEMVDGFGGSFETREAIRQAAIWAHQRAGCGRELVDLRGAGLVLEVVCEVGLVDRWTLRMVLWRARPCRPPVRFLLLRRRPCMLSSLGVEPFVGMVSTCGSDSDTDRPPRQVNAPRSGAIRGYCS